MGTNEYSWEPLKVAGHCPMGCGEHLHLTGHPVRLRCSAASCPRPDAAAELLADGEASHIVEMGARTFTVRHPLRERLDDALMACNHHAWIASRRSAPYQQGRYRVTGNDPATATWEKI